MDIFARLTGFNVLDNNSEAVDATLKYDDGATVSLRMPLIDARSLVGERIQILIKRPGMVSVAPITPAATDEAPKKKRGRKPGTKMGAPTKPVMSKVYPNEQLPDPADPSKPFYWKNIGDWFTPEGKERLQRAEAILAAEMQQKAANGAPSNAMPAMKSQPHYNEPVVEVDEGEAQPGNENPKGRKKS